MSPERTDLVTAPVLEGIANAGKGKTLAEFDIAPFVRVAHGRRPARPAATRCSRRWRSTSAAWARAARISTTTTQAPRLRGGGGEDPGPAFSPGTRTRRPPRFPDALIDETSLVGPPERIKDRLQAWKAAARDHSIGTLVLAGADANALRIVAEAVL